MSSLGRISVVIPSFNYGRYVSEAIESALHQTYRGGVEVIVIDDGSDDDTHEKLPRYAGRIRCILQKNRGVSAARNQGVREAKGEWVALLDADDVWHPQFLEVLANTAEAHDLDVVSALITYKQEELPARVDLHPPVRMLTFEDVASHVPLPPSATMIRRQVLMDAGLFDESLHGTEDRAMWMRLARNRRIGQAQCTPVYYRLHQDQATKNPGRILASYQRTLDKFFAQYPEHAKDADFAYSYMHVDAGIAYLEANYRLAAMRHLMKSLWLFPWLPASRSSHSTSTRLKLLVRAALGERLFRTLNRSRVARPDDLA